jgi:putative transposase
MPYWQLFYHIVWATKGRTPALSPEVQPLVHDLLRQKALGLEARVFALNGTADHVHLVVAIPPKLAVAKFIGQVQAATAARVNKLIGQEGRLIWQEEYGVFSFDGKRLPNYVAYVDRQVEHHSTGTTIPILERVDGNGPRLIRETRTPYQPDADEFRREFANLPGVE